MENNNPNTSSNILISNPLFSIEEPTNSGIIIDTYNKDNINKSLSNINSFSSIEGFSSTIFDNENQGFKGTSDLTKNRMNSNNFSNEISKIYINNIINNTNNIHNYTSDIIITTNKNFLNIQNITKNYNVKTEILNIPSDNIKQSNIFSNTILQTELNNSINKINSTNHNKNFPNKIIDNLKKIDRKYIIVLEILFPLIFLGLIIFIIIYCIKKRKKNQLLTNKINSYDKNGINFQNSSNNTPYNRIQNTSGFNVGINPNNFSMSEIKVQNLKDEINNIITNNSGGSNSSGKRKREKKKIGNNSNLNNSSQENKRGIQNEMKEEIKQYVIAEHLNNI